MNWKAKGLIQGTLSVVPFGSQCSYLLQRTAGQLRSDDFIHRTLEQDVTVLFERMAKLDLDPRRSRILEIGTGWLPVLPLSLALAGFRNVFTVDLYPHLHQTAIRRTLSALRPYLHHPMFRPFASEDQVAQNFDHLWNSTAIFAAAGITYLAPCNAGATQWSSGSMDLITSNNVFEHVPVPGLLAMFAEAKRLLRPGGSVLHCVNCGDHYAYADKSITQLNYLRFSEQQWQRWNNSIQYQNRLRPMDFIQMAEKERLQIRSAEYTARPEALRELEQMEIAPEFRDYPLEQLAATSLTLIASA